MKVADETLNHFVNQTYHWKTLPTHQVLAMAKELKMYRDADMESEADNPDQEQFPQESNEYCPECFQCGEYHHPHCPNG